MWEAPVKVQRTSVGLDVHARSVVACGLDGDTGEVFERRLTPDHREIQEWMRSLPGPVAATYEAPARRGSGWRVRRSLPGSIVRWRRPRSCSAQPEIGSKPMPATPGTWHGCCIWVRSRR